MGGKRGEKVVTCVVVVATQKRTDAFTYKQNKWQTRTEEGLRGRRNRAEKDLPKMAFADFMAFQDPGGTTYTRSSGKTRHMLERDTLLLDLFPSLI